MCTHENNGIVRGLSFQITQFEREWRVDLLALRGVKSITMCSTSRKTGMKVTSTLKKIINHVCNAQLRTSSQSLYLMVTFMLRNGGLVAHSKPYLLSDSF